MTTRDIPDVLAPATLGPITLRNRIIKAATFEAATPGALVPDDLIEYHRRPAAGGVMIRDLKPFWYSLAGVGLFTGLFWLGGLLLGF